MIGYLKGRLLESSPERVILDVGGVGYEILVPATTAAEVERLAGGGEVALHVHTHVREGAIELFGFHVRRQKLLFERLISVGGIGPRLARAILSGMSPEQLVAALTAGDVARLSTISGVGKKTAQRMVVELKDRIADIALDLPPPPPSTDDELVQALVNLGYKPSEAEAAVAATKKDLPDAELEVLLRAALKRLSRARSRPSPGGRIAIDEDRDVDVAVLAGVAPRRRSEQVGLLDLGSRLDDGDDPCGELFRVSIHGQASW